MFLATLGGGAIARQFDTKGGVVSLSHVCMYLATLRADLVRMPAQKLSCHRSDHTNASHHTHGCIISHV